MSLKAIRSQLTISFLLGALTVLGFAPFYLFPIPVLTLALLCHFWRKSATPRVAALLGFFFGMGMFSAGVTWLYVCLHDFGAMPMPIAVLALFVSLRLSRIISSIDGLDAEEVEYRRAHGLVTGCGRVMGIVRLAAQRIVHRFSLADTGLLASAGQSPGGLCCRGGSLRCLADSGFKRGTDVSIF